MISIIVQSIRNQPKWLKFLDVGLAFIYIGLVSVTVEVIFFFKDKPTAFFFIALVSAVVSLAFVLIAAWLKDKSQKSNKSDNLLQVGGE